MKVVKTRCVPGCEVRMWWPHSVVAIDGDEHGWLLLAWPMLKRLRRDDLAVGICDAGKQGGIKVWACNLPGEMVRQEIFE